MRVEFDLPLPGATHMPATPQWCTELRAPHFQNIVADLGCRSPVMAPQVALAIGSTSLAKTANKNWAWPTAMGTLQVSNYRFMTFLCLRKTLSAHAEVSTNCRAHEPHERLPRVARWGGQRPHGHIGQRHEGWQPNPTGFAGRATTPSGLLAGAARLRGEREDLRQRRPHRPRGP
jgi:hypothetical protein